MNLFFRFICHSEKKHITFVQFILYNTKRQYYEQEGSIIGITGSMGGNI